jgi:hypothetical protein
MQKTSKFSAVSNEMSEQPVLQLHRLCDLKD